MERILTLRIKILSMLQNRVDPYGQIIKTKARGSWMGNRGQLHDANQQIRRLFKLKAWIICKLDFKGRHRQVMAPNRYTELFFLDEAMAFAAGHRPCFECRRTDYNNFKRCWLNGNPGYHFDKKTSIQEIDQILHRERIDPNGHKVRFKATIGDLPNGTFIEKNEEPFLLANGQIYPWTSFGYKENIMADPSQKVMVLTPRSTVNAFQAGYKPQMAI